MDTACHGRNLVRAVGGRGKRGSGDERGVDWRGGVVELVAAVEVLAESPGRVLVDGYGRVGVREAADRRDAGNGAGRILVQAVRRVLGDDGRPGLVVVGGRDAVADGIVGKILVEAADRGASLGAAGGDDFAPQVVSVGVGGAGEVAERLAGAGDRRAASRRVVGIAESPCATYRRAQPPAARTRRRGGNGERRYVAYAHGVARSHYGLHWPSLLPPKDRSSIVEKIYSLSDVFTKVNCSTLSP